MEVKQLQKKRGMPVGTKKKPSKAYKTFGFWGGWNQLLEADKINYTCNAQKLQDIVCSRYGLTVRTFKRWKAGRTYSDPIVREGIEIVISKIFNEFGITENIWCDEIM
jgi:hypothetical protein